MSKVIRTRIVKIGNSQGVRIPKLLLEQSGIQSVIISPDEMNRHIATVIIAPMTTKGKAYPTRILCQFWKRVLLLGLGRLRG